MIRFLVLTAWVVALPLVCSAQAESVARPEVRTGDQWVYRVMADETYTTDWNAVSANSLVFTSDSGLLRFPLEAGKTYAVAHEFMTRNVFRTRREFTAKVKGWEEVTVPAGRFRALKIELEGWFQQLDIGFNGKARYELWYVPEVKRWVKLRYESTRNSYMPSSQDVRSGEELVSFKLE